MKIVVSDPERGFTLLEALVSVAIFAIVLVGTISLFATNGQAYRRGQGKAEAQQNARVALEQAAREIRVAGYDVSTVLPSLTSPTAIQVGNSSSLTFVADVTQEGTLDQVTYRQSGTQVLRDFSSWNGSSFPAATSGVVADGIASLAFTYFDSSDASISAPVASGSLGSVARVRISMTSAETMGGQQSSFPVVVDVRLRN